MGEKISVDLGPVQETLLLPLWGRAVESSRRHPRLLDRTAERVVSQIDYDFRTIAKGMSEITRLAWIARCLVFDTLIRTFLRACEAATVVNIGCGFDTTFDRVDNGTVSWVELDLPDVIALRRRIIPERGRQKLVAASVFDRAWEAEVDRSRPVFLLAAGVFYYFTEEEMRLLFARIADDFPGCEMAFDIASTTGVAMANRRVIRAGGMSESAVLKWGIGDARELERWDRRLHVVSDRPMFAEFPKRGAGAARFGMILSDRYRIMSNVHLRVEP